MCADASVFCTLLDCPGLWFTVADGGQVDAVGDLEVHLASGMMTLAKVLLVPPLHQNLLSV
jgi:hypothetical protein